MIIKNKNSISADNGCASIHCIKDKENPDIIGKLGEPWATEFDTKLYLKT